jgi:hypothetical protein
VLRTTFEHTAIDVQARIFGSMSAIVASVSSFSVAAFSTILVNWS